MEENIEDWQKDFPGWIINFIYCMSKQNTKGTFDYAEVYRVYRIEKVT
jgi:hypothetical protein